ncbi:MAG: hypothetical protein K6G86_00360 [Bacteroidales bacterium]|nr:hypothetical protein [Bacteroidales bacterium]
MIRRRIDRILAQGEGRQLVWLAGIVLALYLVFCLIGRIWGLGWTDVLTLYLDAGNFPIDHQANDIFSLIVALSGLLILSTLLISVFSNVFSNISEAYRKGERRYRFSGHVLILGGGHPLADMLRALRENRSFDGKDIVVMTSADVEKLRAETEIAVNDTRFCKRITWCHGDRSKEEDLRSVRAANAAAIYLIGEDDEEAHDSLSVFSLDLLERICEGSGAPIPCYVTLEMHASLDIFQYLPNSSVSRLRPEIIHTGDYIAEQLLVDTQFLPVPSGEEYLHIVIAGSARAARSFASVAAHICHFPGFAEGKHRTRISFVDAGIRERMDQFVSNHQNLFDLSHYSYVTPEGREDMAPRPEYGDFQDIEWEFIDSPLASPYVRAELSRWAQDAGQKLVLAICQEDSDTNLTAALHLPKALYTAGIPIAVYQKEHGELMEKAVSTGMFGIIRCYGESGPANDALFLRRSLRGKRVNYLYDLEYGNPPAANEDEAWATLSFAHKLSSIASANSIPIKLRSFSLEATRSCMDALDDGQLEALSEVEHRRWMTSVLLMGYSAAPAADRADRSRFKELKNKQFIHLDIAPYDELAREAEKDRLIVMNIPYIMNEEEIVRV